MKRPGNLLSQKRAGQIVLVASIASLLILSYLCVLYLHEASLAPERFRSAVSLILFLFFIPTILGWIQFGLWAGVFFVPVAFGFSILAA